MAVKGALVRTWIARTYWFRRGGVPAHLRHATGGGALVHLIAPPNRRRQRRLWDLYRRTAGNRAAWYYLPLSGEPFVSE
jgi:hypothetical protein